MRNTMRIGMAHSYFIVSWLARDCNGLPPEPFTGVPRGDPAEALGAPAEEGSRYPPPLPLRCGRASYSISRISGIDGLPRGKIRLSKGPIAKFVQRLELAGQRVKQAGAPAQEGQFSPYFCYQ